MPICVHPTLAERVQSRTKQRKLICTALQRMAGRDSKRPRRHLITSDYPVVHLRESWSPRRTAEHIRLVATDLVLPAVSPRNALGIGRQSPGSALRRGTPEVSNLDNATAAVAHGAVYCRPGHPELLRDLGSPQRRASVRRNEGDLYQGGLRCGLLQRESGEDNKAHPIERRLRPFVVFGQAVSMSRSGETAFYDSIARKENEAVSHRRRLDNSQLDAVLLRCFRRLLPRLALIHKGNSCVLAGHPRHRCGEFVILRPFLLFGRSDIQPTPKGGPRYRRRWWLFGPLYMLVSIAVAPSSALRGRLHHPSVGNCRRGLRFLPPGKAQRGPQAADNRFPEMFSHSFAYATVVSTRASECCILSCECAVEY